MGKKSQAIVFTEPGRIELQEFKLPPCGEKEVIAETMYTFVSPGTELRVLSGIKESKGKFPLIPGYSWVGRVIEVGSQIKGWEAGQMVTGRNPLPLPGINSLWGGQASLHRCEVTGYDAVLKLPEGCDPWDYIPLEVAAISWRGTSITFPAPGETAVVVGQGLIGAFAAKWLLYHGARVIVVDLCESRLNKARKWGVAAALGGNAPDIRDRILSYCPGGADIVVEASASTRGAELAGSLLRQPASRAQNREYSVPALHSDAHFWPRVSFLASYPQSFQTGPNGLVTVEGAIVCKSGDRSLGDRLAVMERIRQGDLLVADIIEGATPVDQAPQAYAELRDHSDRKAALAFKW